MKKRFALSVSVRKERCDHPWIRYAGRVPLTGPRVCGMCGKMVQPQGPRISSAPLTAADIGLDIPEMEAYHWAILEWGKMYRRAEAIRWGCAGDREDIQTALAAAGQRLEEARTALRQSQGLAC